MCENHEAAHHGPSYPTFDDCVRFHGHSCPGLATGYRVSTAAMRTLGVNRPYDEELVCIAETDACGVDAVQLVTGCTAGKGNLIIRDYGKHVFSFFSRESGRAIRVLVRNSDIPGRSGMDELRKKVFSGIATPDEIARFREMMAETTRSLLAAPEDDLLEIREVTEKPPEKARIFASVVCGKCGEPVADVRTRVVDGRRVCIPCAQAREISGRA
ncbi:MAG TPA: FmdE family protein [Methanoregulaceae archaeon]|nr:FmdE family protein [Methanoregulaceae archaeon]